MLVAVSVPDAFLVDFEQAVESRNAGLAPIESQILDVLPRLATVLHSRGLDGRHRYIMP